MKFWDELIPCLRLNTAEKWYSLETQNYLIWFSEAGTPRKLQERHQYAAQGGHLSTSIPSVDTLSLVMVPSRGDCGVGLAASQKGKT